MTEPVGHEIFDPYHKWLGISPRDQPPHYYRLLAIDLFESDADVISAAADKQMAFIRSFQTGKNAQLSQKILNEIAAARVCLLNSAKKAEYDATLRARLAAAGEASGIKRAQRIAGAAVAPTGEEVVVLSELADAEIPLPRLMSMGGGERSGIRTKNLKKSSIVPLVALGAMLAVSVAVIAFVMSRTPETHVSQAGEDADVRVARNAEPHRSQPAGEDNKPQLPPDQEKPAPPEDPLGSSPSRHSTAATTPAKTPESVAPPVAFQPKPKPPGEKRPDIKPGIGDDPFLPKSDPVTEPETPAKPAEVKKGKTPEELDKQLADATTPEDYQAVAQEALFAAGKAMEDRQPDVAKRLILKALVAARKSGDSKLIIQATRALTKPESIPEILAENDKRDGDSAVDSRPQNTPGGTSGETPATSGRQGPRIATTGRIGLSGVAKRGVSFGSVRQGTSITLQYDGGTWTNPATHESINPDDPSQASYRVAIVAKSGTMTNIFIMPGGTAVRAVRWQAPRDYDSLTVERHSSAPDPLAGRVYYRITISPPRQ